MNNSLAEVHPELVSEWSEKNLTLTPDDITFGSNKKVWWRGACGHEYDSTIMGDMTSGFLVLNRHTQKTVTVAGSKFWENDAGKENLRLRIYRD